VEEGLAAALQRLADERQNQVGMRISLEITGEFQDERLSEAVKANLYSITQEALNNIAKHAGTTQAVVRLNLASDPACLEVIDAGRGFDLQGTGRSGGFGLGEMAGRAREIGWELEIDSAPGLGTHVRAWEKSG